MRRSGVGALTRPSDHQAAKALAIGSVVVPEPHLQDFAYVRRSRIVQEFAKLGLGRAGCVLLRKLFPNLSSSVASPRAGLIHPSVGELGMTRGLIACEGLRLSPFQTNLKF